MLGGAVVADLTADGAGGLTKRRGYYYAGGGRVAKLDGDLRFEHAEPGTNSWVEVRASDRIANRKERDASGGELPLYDPSPEYGYVQTKGNDPLYIDGTDPFDFSSGATMDGMPVSQAQLEHMLDTGSAVAELLINGNRIGSWDFTGRVRGTGGVPTSFSTERWDVSGSSSDSQLIWDSADDLSDSLGQATVTARRTVDWYNVGFGGGFGFNQQVGAKGGVSQGTRKGAATQTPTDPCAGRKGSLDHFANPRIGIPHITPRHIEQTPEFQGQKSYYTFVMFTSTLTDKQTVVMNLNQEAFENGGAIRQGSRTAYIYAPYGQAGYGPFKVEGFAVGRDADHNWEFTNVRTVIVDKDCKTVITSFPGLPRNISPSDPRIVGNPHWWQAINTRL